MKTSEEKGLFKVVYNVESDDIYYYLVRYWKSGKTMISPRQMLFTALSAFWLPFALRVCGKFSSIELRQYAAIAIRQLQEQIHVLEMHFLVGEATSASTNNYPQEQNLELHDAVYAAQESESVDEDLFN